MVVFHHKTKLWLVIGYFSMSFASYPKVKLTVYIVS